MVFGLFTRSWSLQAAVTRRQRAGMSTRMDALVRSVAEKIGVHNVEPICEKLRSNCVVEVWQLGHLDGSQWRELGVPIGLAAALQHFAATSANDSFASGAEASSTPLSDAGGSLPSAGLKRVTGFARITHFRDWFLPFDHQLGFKRAVLNAKDGADLRTFMLTCCEMWVLLLSLLLGTICALWEQFPDHESLPKDFCLASNWVFLAAVTACFVALFMQTVLFTIASSISVQSRFKRFYAIAIPIIQCGDNLLHLTVCLFVVLVALVFYAKHVTIACDASDAASFDACREQLAPSTLPALIIYFLLASLLVYNVNWLSRMTVHGGLLGRRKRSGASATSLAKRLPSERKKGLQELFRDLVISEEGAIATYKEEAKALDAGDATGADEKRLVV